MKQGGLIRVATRGSKLALTQTNWAIRQLQAANPSVSFETVIIKTRGDRGDLSVMGAFIKELEHSLLEGTVDLAIHSLKDLPTAEPEGLQITCIPVREDARDVLISKNNARLEEMPKGSKIGTGSPRRIHQIQAINPEVNVVFIRGNIDTRIGYVDKGEVDAVVLAAAGVHRLSMHNRISQYFDVQSFVPAPGQGALALQTRIGDKRVLEIVKKIHHPESELAIKTERKILEDVGGGCQLPIGCHMQKRENGYEVNAFYGLNEQGALNKARITNLEDSNDQSISELIQKLIGQNAMHEG